MLAGPRARPSRIGVNPLPYRSPVSCADLPPVVDMPGFPGANEPCRKHAFSITLGYLTT